MLERYLPVLNVGTHVDTEKYQHQTYHMHGTPYTGEVMAFNISP